MAKASTGGRKAGGGGPQDAPPGPVLTAKAVKEMMVTASAGSSELSRKARRSSLMGWAARNVVLR